MIEVKYFGGNCFRVRGKDLYLVVGKPPKKIQADVFLVGKADHFSREKCLAKTRREPFIISGPGEYEISGIEVWGGADNYWLIRMGNWRLCFADLGWQVPEEKRAEELSQVDIMFLVLPSGKVSAKEAAEVVKRVSPLVVIPGRPDGENQAISSWAISFLDEMDREDLKAQDKLKLERKDLPEETQIILLKEGE